MPASPHVNIHQKHRSVSLLSALTYLLLGNGHTKAEGKEEKRGREIGGVDECGLGLN